MSILHRLRERLAKQVSPTEPPAPSIPVPAAAPAASKAGPESTADTAIIAAQSIADILRVEEVTDAEYFVGDLFRRRFGGNPPDYPRSFVAFYRPTRTRFVAIGYVHYMVFEDSYMCGGMVMDERQYRQIPAPHRAIIKAAGGVAETMLRDTFARLAHAPAIWGYVGDKLAEQVDLRAGFRHTHDPHVMVVWNHELPEEEKAARLARVIALGPF